jgi:hypothetical protein
MENTTSSQQLMYSPKGLLSATGIGVDCKVTNSPRNGVWQDSYTLVQCRSTEQQLTTLASRHDTCNAALSRARPSTHHVSPLEPDNKQLKVSNARKIAIKPTP